MSMLEELAEEDFDTKSSIVEPPKNASNIKSLLDELEDDMEDLGEIKRKYMPKILPDDDEFNSSQVPIDTITKREVQDLIDCIPKPMVQKPFQPGSSPNDEDNRFFCWNNTGIIRAQKGNEELSVDVMFHDTEKHSSINFRNEPNYSFGSLSDDVIVVGTNGRYATGPSSIHGVNLLETNRDQREWDVQLPHVELIEALCAGSGFLAVTTDQGCLRLFTNGGMQSYTITLPRQILCMNAQDNKLMIVYHDGAGNSDEQSLSMVVYHVELLTNTFKLILDRTPVALTKRSPLAWAGFSDEGAPCTYDYSGILRMFRPELAKSWVPLLDMRELNSSALDHFFVVGVSEMSQAVRAVRCHRSRYPDFKAETAEVFSFSLTMCETDTTKGKLEEEQLRLRLAGLSYDRLSHMSNLSLLAEAANEANDKLLVNNVLKLFSHYLKEGQEDTARSLVFIIPREHTSKLPEFAWKIGRPHYFIESLNRAIEEREQMESDLAARNDDDVISVSSVVSFGKDLRKELDKSKTKFDNDIGDNKLKPIPLETLTNNVQRGNISNDKTQEEVTKPDILDDSDEDENDNKKSKRTKSVNYNIFKKKAKNV